MRGKKVMITATVTGVAIVGATAWHFASASSSDKTSDTASSQQPAGQSSTSAGATPTSPAAGATTPTPTPPTAATSADPSAPGAFASDGTTLLSTFPSLSAITNALPAGSRTVTTIDPRYQNAASTALGSHPDSAMVVLQASTGHILAAAFEGPADVDRFQATLAPGSTFKVITAEDLLRNGLTTSSSMPCVTKNTQYNVVNDSPSLTNPSATLDYAFTWSCNTSFVGKIGLLDGSGSPLDKESSTYFGLNKPWNLGLGAATYGASGADNVPSASGGQFAQEMFGQGGITVSPLDMASVAATVDNGRFHQPVLLPGQKPLATATPLNSHVDSELKTLMLDTVSKGTAKSLRGLSPAVGAKTGTAEPGDQGPNNSWMIAYQGDIAVACVVQGGNFGDESAGPAVAALFNAAAR
jgi:cell division protein FtsI/penicillin-binding protein 2